MKRAIVMGGSHTGLFTARALSAHFEDAVVIEPDLIRDDGLGRQAPQRHQLHALLAMGHTQLERWFPRITDELAKGGALPGKSDDVQFSLDGRLKAPVAEASMLGATQPFLESHLRHRAAAVENMRFCQAQVTRLVLRGDRMAGVTTAASEHETEGGERFDAESVVDAMGRNSPLEDRLVGHG
ncbi:hypothetical protein [Streptomyces vietnamensis]|uniref:hypothetical protein n=1 Tax=Streptomyces vietnamensis TaxID=362257 RepID=UPI0034311B20